MQKKFRPMTKIQRDRQKQYVAGLDGLRAVAVLMVLAYHLRLPIAKGGLLGVTVFFVISGFLITRILVSELENTNTVHIKKFWIRRVRRLLPAVLVMVTVLTFVSAVFNRVLFTKVCSDLPSVVLGYNNWWQIFNDVSYFENAGAPSPLTHCWSLAIETQFYMLYPLLLLCLKKCTQRHKDWQRIAARVTILTAFISLGAMCILFDPSKDPTRVYYGTDTRAFSLLFGAYLVFMMKSGRPKKALSGALKNVVGIISFLILFYLMVKIDGFSSFFYRGGQGIASACTVLVIFSLLDEGSILNRVLSVYPLRWIGDRSYGIYLWHYPVIILLGNGGRQSWWVYIVEVLLIFTISDLSYRFIETPIRNGIIGKSIETIRRRPRTRKERSRQIRVLRRSISAGLFTLVMASGVLMCMTFVPRKAALSDVRNMEKQAEKAKKIADQKMVQMKDSALQANQQINRAALRSDEEISGSLNLLLIGDSIALGAADRFYEVFPAGICDAAVSRQATAGPGIYNTYASDKGWNGDGVIVALGANGLLHNTLDQMRELLGKDRPLFVVTVRAPYVNWEMPNNETIDEFVKSTENTYLIDWYKISEGHGEYFAEDGTHLSSEGIQAYVNGVKETVLEVYRTSAQEY